MRILRYFFTLLLFGISNPLSANEQQANINLLESKYKNVLKINNAELRQAYKNEAQQVDTEIKIQNDFRVLTSLIPTYKKKYGSESKEIIQLYFEIAASKPKHVLSIREEKKYEDFYWRAINSVKAFAKAEPEYQAYVHLNAAHILTETGTFQYKKLLDLLSKTRKFYTTNHPENSHDRIAANIYYAGLQVAFGQSTSRLTKAENYYNNAIEALNPNLAILKNVKGPTHDFDLKTRAILISAYEGLGDSAAATQHCISIGTMQPWSDSQQQEPLFRIEPLYPRMKRIMGRNGTVEIEFTVSADGFVQNPKILKSEGGISFEKEALIALKKWRYAPKFKNGIPIAAKSTVVLDFEIQEF
jgi:TonB family protein